MTGRARLLAAAAALAVLAGRPVAAGTVILNQGTASVQNEANVAQPAVVATVNFTVQANPALAIRKTANPPVGVTGQRAEYTLAMTYPQIGASCGDDSPAAGVSLTDTIPAGMTYVANSTSVSVDNGATFGLGTDAADGTDVPGIAAVTFSANRVTVTFIAPVAECATGAATRVVKFAVTVN